MIRCARRAEPRAGRTVGPVLPVLVGFAVTADRANNETSRARVRPRRTVSVGESEQNRSASHTRATVWRTETRTIVVFRTSGCANTHVACVIRSWFPDAVCTSTEIRSKSYKKGDRHTFLKGPSGLICFLSNSICTYNALICLCLSLKYNKFN